jgi:hypothetical protein
MKSFNMGSLAKWQPCLFYAPFSSNGFGLRHKSSAKKLTASVVTTTFVNVILAGGWMDGGKHTLWGSGQNSFAPAPDVPEYQTNLYASLQLLLFPRFTARCCLRVKVKNVVSVSHAIPTLFFRQPAST